jgi:hypothetical protein
MRNNAEMTSVVSQAASALAKPRAIIIIQQGRRL